MPEVNYIEKITKSGKSSRSEIIEVNTNKIAEVNKMKQLEFKFKPLQEQSERVSQL